jgi:NAD(P)-dependent dehydrogenase (short-subunit alcohol dehydrogenase family)
MSELRGLRGKNVLVTGAAKGQGFSHVTALAEAGCHIAALDVTHEVPGTYALATAEMLDETVRVVQERGVRCIGLPCDVRYEEQVEPAVAKALDFFDGRIDVLVNNAGVAAAGPVTEVCRADVDLVLDTNVKGPIAMAKQVVPGMIEAGRGVIINISSSVTAVGVASLSPYVASKFAVEGLTRAWAVELAEFGINVNAIAPTQIKPGPGQGSGMLIGMAAAWGMDADELYEQASVDYNLKGPKWRGTTAHITDGLLFLASDNADQITGHVLRVDSGMSAR